MTNIGVLFSLVLVFGGLLALMIYSLKGKNIDRRIIFLFIFVSVLAAVLFNIEFKEHPSLIVQQVFDYVENLPAGSRVLVAFDFDPAMKPEVHPMANAFVRHCLTRGHKLFLMSLWGTGQALMTETIDSVIVEEFPSAKYGADYVALGYKAGNEGVLNVIITDFRKMYPTDEHGTNVDSIPLFQNVRSAKDMDFIMAIGGGAPGPKEWILYIGDPGRVPMAAGLAAVSTPAIYSYYPKQIVGLLGGVKGAAEYESALRQKYPQFQAVPAPALRMMGPQTLAHIVVMAFIIIGNLTYFRGRRNPDA